MYPYMANGMKALVVTDAVSGFQGTGQNPDDRIKRKLAFYDKKCDNFGKRTECTFVQTSYTTKHMCIETRNAKHFW